MEQGLFLRVGASSSLAPAHALVLLLSGAGGVRSPVLICLLLLPPHMGISSAAAPGAEEESHTGGTPLAALEPPLKLMAITENQMKGTAMDPVTRPLLQEQSRST